MRPAWKQGDENPTSSLGSRCKKRAGDEPCVVWGLPLSKATQLRQPDSWRKSSCSFSIHVDMTHLRIRAQLQGELFDLIVRNKSLSESEASTTAQPALLDLAKKLPMHRCPAAPASWNPQAMTRLIPWICCREANSRQLPTPAEEGWKPTQSSLL